MRQLFAIILSFLYIALSTGADVNIHFCGGEIKSVHINETSNICCCSSDKMASDCCKDENLILGLNTDQTIISIQDILPEQIVLVTLFINQFELLAESDNEVISDNYFIPPPNIKPIWLLNCTFTFYG